MPAILGIGAEVLLIGAILILFTTYWVLIHLRDYAKSLVWPISLLAGVVDYVAKRNEELLRFVVGVAESLLGWSIQQFENGFKALHDFFNATLNAQTVANQSAISGLQGLANNILHPAILGLQAGFTSLGDLVHGFVIANINALNFWKAGADVAINTFLIPNVNALISRVDVVTGLTIPTIQARLGVAERTITQTLPAEIAETKTDVSAVQRVIQQTTTAPKTGLLDRATELEKGLAQVLPWAAAIGISIPVAANLARLGRNPCWCQTEGPLQDNGTLELATLMDLL